MAIIIRSTFSKPDRPARQLEPGEFEAYTAKLKAAFVGRDLPDPPAQQFFELTTGTGFAKMHPGLKSKTQKMTAHGDEHKPAS